MTTDSTRDLQLKRKVYAYITHGNRLLVFAHAYAGIQVPGGTVEEDEHPDDAVMREALEETGLADLRCEGFLGECRVPFPQWGVTHHRRYYHLVCTGTPPETWIHYEMTPSDGSPAPIEFTFFWASLPDNVPPLIGDMDQMLPHLLAKLGLQRRES